MASKDDDSIKKAQPSQAASRRGRGRKVTAAPAAAPDESAPAAPKPPRRRTKAQTAPLETAAKQTTAKQTTAKPARPRKTAAKPPAPEAVATQAKPTKKPATKPAGRTTRAHAPVRSDTRTSSRRKATTHKPDQTEARQEAQPEATTPPRTTPETAATTTLPQAAYDSMTEAMATNIEKIETLTQRLVAAFSRRRVHTPAVEGPGPDLFMSSAQAWMKLLSEQPARLVEQQVSYWGETLKHYARLQETAARGKLAVEDDPDEKDKRFQNPLWRTHPFFDAVRRQYRINADAMLRAARELQLPHETDRIRVEWFTRQLVDMMAPTNFLATNPDALQRAVETEGRSLIKGLENLVRDVEAAGGEMIVSLADRDAFSVGENIGTAEGRVVRRERLYELIQYSPTTEQVHQIPLVIFPPWINKFYIMDLKPQNSLIRWIVDQGYTLFVVSWKNPDASFADVSLQDYAGAYLTVMDQVLAETGQEKLNAIGYCIAGTTLSLVLALLKSRGDDRVNSATFFTTLTDFSDQGEFTTYLTNDFVNGLDEEVVTHGILPAQLMTRTFSFLRANDLVWGPAIRSYMMGEAPPAFDLLYWNGDATNLPGRMAMDYLRGLCQDNLFAGAGLTLFGQELHLKDVTVPLCAIACETDHIAPWLHSWKGISQMGSPDKRFILSESGHIAGIINPPSKKKYGHYTSDAGFDGGAAAWKQAATYHEGSWWPRWQDWLSGHSGPMVPARTPVEGFGAAPGTYVKEGA
ncbi:MAG: class I poly(R)-hydroxyalkanoic acid synthase [Paracoccus sp. (in: a-proteobacteria)]|uniref:class I poly(R)-hydroxyalkanoic acid synthase n=1 Tax=Paracoccus sp. TaxID=267 RepID=UPI0026E0D953|nr:class I poly(R)-hydroxyalkanoic acid synthase [Paracoccus sp. (in: a-proteobacteria)]MDO5622572.1 class I poly(R)-hydroxyalkanoic acid synthase [Paracoccus sp. (in: a-proteobacteria)]